MLKCQAGKEIPEDGPCPYCGAHPNQACGETMRKLAEAIAARRAERERTEGDVGKVFDRGPDKRTVSPIIETF